MRKVNKLNKLYVIEDPIKEHENTLDALVLILDMSKSLGQSEEQILDTLSAIQRVWRELIDLRRKTNELQE